MSRVGYKWLILVTLLLPMQTIAWDDIGEKLSNVPTMVQEVKSGGVWSEGDKAGYYRFIIVGGGIEHYKTKLFVQWISYETDEALPKLLVSTSIVELNEAPIHAFNLPKCKDETCSSIYFEALNTYDLNEHMVEIDFTGIGQYQLKQK